MKKNLEKIINRIDKLGRKITKLDLKYLIKSGSWQVTNNFSNILIGFLLSIAFANLLSDKDFGIYTYLISITKALSFLTLSGLAVATTQAVARGYNTALITSKKLHQKWNFIYTIGLLAVASYYLFNNNYLFAGSLTIIAFTTPFIIAYQSYSNFLLGKKSFKKIAIYSIIKNIFHLVLIVGVLMITKSILAVIIAHVLSLLLPSIYFYQKTKKDFSVESKRDINEDKSLFKFGLNISFLNVLSSIAGNIDNILLFQLIGPAQLATYVFAKKASETGRGMVKNVLIIYFPKLVNKKLEDIKSIFSFRILQTIVISILLATSLILIIPFVFQYFFPKYPDSVFYAQLLSLGVVFAMPNAYMGFIFHSHKMMRQIYITNILPNIVRIIGFAILGLLFGIIGIVAAKLIGDLVLFIISILVFRNLKSYTNTN